MLKKKKEQQKRYLKKKKMYIYIERGVLSKHDTKGRNIKTKHCKTFHREKNER